MVNKGSFFQRLKDRWGSGSGVRVEASAEGAPEGAPEATNRVSGEPAPGGETNRARAVSSIFQPSGARSSRKMSDREQAMMTVGQHFQELSQLMRGAQAASDEKLEKIFQATTSMSGVGAQQLEVLKALSAQMSKQNELGDQLSTTMHRLPGLLENVEKALDRAAKTDERTAATVREFESTMGRIHASMGQMVENSTAQAEATKELAERRAEEFEQITGEITRSHAGAVGELQRASESNLEALRRTHEDQSKRLQRVVEVQTGWNRAVIVGVVLVVLGVGAVITLQLMG
jgi:uncharacterized phage infection (PIP) family protein YhgE